MSATCVSPAKRSSVNASSGRPELGVVDTRRVAGDDAERLEAVDPALDRRRREAARAGRCRPASRRASRVQQVDDLDDRSRRLASAASPRKKRTRMRPSRRAILRAGRRLRSRLASAPRGSVASSAHAAPPRPDSAAERDAVDSRCSTPCSGACSGSRRASSTTPTRCARRRPGVKVGGHQASSASMVSIMTALYFAHLRAPDRVSVKPHAAPVLHAINYLLGRLDASLPDRAARVRRAAELPEPGQGPRPGRLLDRLGRHRRDRDALERARPPLRRRPLRRPPGRPPGRAASATPSSTRARSGRRSSIRWSPRLGEVLWIVDLNRQSLDRVVPDIAAGRIGAMFEAAGWQTITVKYGRRLRELFARAAARRCASASTR